MKYAPRGLRLSTTTNKVTSSKPKPINKRSNTTSYPVAGLVKIALGEVGCHEEGGNNRGPQVVKYQKATWLKPDAWPWCAAFVCWCIMVWQLKYPNMPNFERPETASAFEFESWAKRQGFKILSDICQAKAGDICIFDFSHIGLVVMDQVDQYIETVEGNTNGLGTRDSISGDGVWKKRRHRSLVKCFARFEKV